MARPTLEVSELGSGREFKQSECYIIVKAAPRTSQKFGETVCIAGLTGEGDWVRLYPVSFRDLEDSQRFGRWHRITYRGRRPDKQSDSRIESRRVDPHSIQIIGELPERQRNSFLNRVAVNGLRRELEQGRSLALLKVDVTDFYYRKKSLDDLKKEQVAREQLISQSDFFVAEKIIPRNPCPFSFHYKYLDEDGSHVGTCQDWETEATFLRRRAELGEVEALNWMMRTFGEEYPRKGMALAMGTHRYRADQWLINGIVRFEEEKQMSFL